MRSLARVCGLREVQSCFDGELDSPAPAEQDADRARSSGESAHCAPCGVKSQLRSQLSGALRRFFFSCSGNVARTTADVSIDWSSWESPSHQTPELHSRPGPWTRAAWSSVDQTRLVKYRLPSFVPSGWTGRSTTTAEGPSILQVAIFFLDSTTPSGELQTNPRGFSAHRDSGSGTANLSPRQLFMYSVRVLAYYLSFQVCAAQALTAGSSLALSLLCCVCPHCQLRQQRSLLGLCGDTRPVEGIIELQFKQHGPSTLATAKLFGCSLYAATSSIGLGATEWIFILVASVWTPLISTSTLSDTLCTTITCSSLRSDVTFKNSQECASTAQDGKPTSNRNSQECRILVLVSFSQKKKNRCVAGNTPAFSRLAVRALVLGKERWSWCVARSGEPEWRWHKMGMERVYGTACQQINAGGVRFVEDLGMARTPRGRHFSQHDAACGAEHLVLLSS